MLFLLFLFDK
jgi:hypothetical protein